MKNNYHKFDTQRLIRFNVINYIAKNPVRYPNSSSLIYYFCLKLLDIQKAYKAKVQSEPKVAAYDPLCPQTHPTGEEAKSEAVIFNAFKYLILKFMHEKAHLNHSEGKKS